ncbi:MAG TPA: hypothetical protein QGF58_23365 [Myxococcota bacterium]|nr:hypothetical protein [Myxococcota bacterium]
MRLLRRLSRRRPLDASPVDARRGPLLQLRLGRPGFEDRRDLHRWFLDLARRGEAEEACSRLGRWILADRPGEGADWEHASDAAVRLVYWGLGVGVLGEELDPDLWRRMAGSARAHAEFTLREDSPHPVAQGSGLVVAGSLFPDLSELWVGEGLSRLARAMPEVVAVDGSGAPDALQRAVCLGLVARSFATLPPEAEGALYRGASYLRVVSAGGPPLDTARHPALLGESAEELADALGVEDDLDIGREWSLRAYRATNRAVGHARLKGVTSRLLVEHGSLSWHLDGEALIGALGPAEGELSSARVDDRRATLAWGARKVLAEGGRVQILEQGCAGLRVQRGPGWERLKVGLDKQLCWQEQGDWLVGVGSAERVRCSFELR